MSVQLDPIIRKKLRDFGRRRLKLIFLRGLCSGVVSLLAVFSCIALVDYLTQARIPDDLRSVISYCGYLVVFLAIWKTCARLLLDLPGQRQMARLIEQTSPEFHEDLLSAVELGGEEARIADSEAFRNLVQKDVASRIKDLDVTQILPIARLRRWLFSTAGLVALIIGLLTIPEFGMQFQRLFGRALLPGANIAPVTDLQATILAPLDSTRMTPRNEPLRFLVEIDGEREDLGRIEIQTRMLNKRQSPLVMSPRQNQRFSVDYNVGREPFEFRILEDGAPIAMKWGSELSQWFNMEVASRPYVISYEKTYTYPSYTRLEPSSSNDQRGDLQAWEGTVVELLLHTNQAVGSGQLKLDLVGAESSPVPLEPVSGGMGLRAEIPLLRSGTYRVVEVRSTDTGWNGKPSQAFEIIAQPDESPQIRIVDPKERSILLATDDILPLSFYAQDDLALESIAYLVRVNNRPWIKFDLPGIEQPIDRKEALAQFDLDLLKLKLNPNDKVLVKFVAKDRKGTHSESETLELSIISRDLDLSATEVLKLESMMVNGLRELSYAAESRSKEGNALSKSFKEKRWVGPTGNLRETALSIREEAELLYEKSLAVLPAMPRGANSFEISFLARAVNGLVHHQADQALLEADLVRDAADPKAKEAAIRAFQTKLNEDKNRLGNLRNVSQDNLDHQIRAVGAGYLSKLLQNQKDLVESIKKTFNARVVARRQEVSFKHWQVIAKLFKLGRSSFQGPMKNVERMEASVKEAIESESPDPEKISQEISTWNERLRQFENQLLGMLRGNVRNFKSSRQNLIWNVNASWEEISELHRRFSQYENDTQDNDPLINLIGQRQIPSVVASLQGRARLEERRKDADSRFVKDLGQFARGLRRMGDALRLQLQENERPIGQAEGFKEMTGLLRIIETYHDLTEALSLANSIGQRENWEMGQSDALAERAIEWGATTAPWRPLADRIRGMPVQLVDGSVENRDRASKVMRDLQNRPFVKQIDQEMERRTREPQKPPRSASKQVKRIQEELKFVLSLLKPAVREARKRLDALAPSLAELARALVVKTRSLELESSEILEKGIKEEFRKMTSTLQSEQRALGKEIELFNEALRQEANIQNLLDEEGREIARDADDAAAFLQAKELSIEQAIEQSLQSLNFTDQNSALAKARDGQGQLAEFLEALAEHFEGIKEGKDVAQTREELRATEEEIGTKDEMEKRFEEAKRLAELAQLPAEELLAELERELTVNEPMQKELAQIEEDIIEQVEENLQEAAQEEKEIAQEVENSDKQVAQKKKELAKELAKLSNEIEKLADQEVERAADLAEKAKAGMAEESLEDSSDTLEDIAQDLKEQAKPENTASDLSETAEELAQALEEEAANLQIAAEMAKEVSELTPEEAKSESEEAEKEARETRQSAQELAEEAEIAQQEAKQANDDAVQEIQEALDARTEAAQALSNLEEQEKDAAQKPNDPEAQKAVEEAKLEKNEAQELAAEKMSEAKESQAKAQELNQKANQAEKLAQEAQLAAEQKEAESSFAQERAELSPPQLANANKDAERAQQEAEKAAKKAEQLAQQAQEISDRLSQLEEEAEPQLDALAKAQDEQVELGQDLVEAAEDLARAARHEERLGKEASAQALEEIADGTQDAATEVAEAAQELQNEALAQQLEELGEEAIELAERQTVQEASDHIPLAQEAQDELETAAQEVREIVDSNPSFEEIAQAAQEFSDQAQKVADDFAEAAQEAQQMAKQAEESFEQAQELAKEARENTQAAQDQEAASPNDPNAQELEPANEALQLAQEAERDALAEVKAAKEALNDANELAEAGFETAQDASELAEAAESFAEGFPQEPSFAEGMPTETKEDSDSQGGAGEALAEAAASIEDQAEAIESFDESPSPQEPGSELTSAEETLADQSSTNMENGAEAYPYDSPLSNPETALALAQTLDALDQALHPLESPFLGEETEGDPSPSTPLEEMTQSPTSENNSEPANPDQASQQSSSEQPSSGPGESSSPSSAEALNQAAQALAQATQAQAMAMAAARIAEQKALIEGSTLNSGEGSEVDAAARITLQDLPIPNLENNSELEWNQLPPKLAKDLMGGKREAVSGEFRNRVEAYFRAMSDQSRQTRR